MHRAPAVNFSVKRARWHARFLVCTGVLARMTLSAFVLEQGPPDVRGAVLALAMLVAGSLAFVGWKQSPQGSLRWDGEHWHWSGFAANPQCHVRALMDFQSVMLVTVTAEAHAPVFLWLEAGPGDAAWRPLRRAIVSSQAAGKQPGPGIAGDLA
jgi:toxin CptA